MWDYIKNMATSSFMGFIMRLLIKISACMLIVAVVSVCLLLRCPDTSELNKLLNGDGTVSFDYYTITPDRIAITVTNKSSVEYLRVQFLRTVKTGRAGSLNVVVQSAQG